MAVRSGAGTGVVVSLVVFIMTTVFLLVLTIVFYAGKVKEHDAAFAADQRLNAFVRSTERNTDTIKGFENAAKLSNQSVAQYLNGRYEGLMTYLGVAPNANVEQIKTELSRFKTAQTKEDDTIRTRLSTLYKATNDQKTEIDGLNTQLASCNSQIAEKETQLKQARDAAQQQVNEVESRIASYRDSTVESQKRMQEAIDELNKAKDTLRTRYESRERELNAENDRIGQELGVAKDKIAMFEKARAEATFKARNPAMLVDGKIIDAPGSSDEVFIDRGKKDRVVLGMTFEVYGQSSQIAVVNPQTGEVARGKASLQVTKVSDTTSTCKITRSIPGNPIIKGDVIANAIYDPMYKFKFLVHGKFDVDGDGRATEQEAEYLRSLVIEWGGTVVTGDELPGDLDFLVLGLEPPIPPPPPDDAAAVVYQDYMNKRQANDKYNQLFRQAREAQIPVLNANRFFILTGHTDR